MKTKHDFLEGASFDTPSFYRLDFHITTAQPIFAISIRRTKPHTTISQDCLFGVCGQKLPPQFRYIACLVCAATPRLPRHYVPRNDIRNIPLAHAVRLTLLVDRRSQRKIRHRDDDNKRVYCHKSHLNFAFLIAPIIFALISSCYKTLTTISQNYRLDVFPFNKRHS